MDPDTVDGIRWLDTVSLNSWIPTQSMVFDSRDRIHELFQDASNFRAAPTRRTLTGR